MMNVVETKVAGRRTQGKGRSLGCVLVWLLDRIGRSESRLEARSTPRDASKQPNQRQAHYEESLGRGAGTAGYIGLYMYASQVLLR